MTLQLILFTEGHYRVTIRISKNDESLVHGGEVGMFVIHVIGPNGKQTERISLSANSEYYEPGTVHTVVLPGDVVGKPEAVEITWEYQTSVFNPLTWRLLHKPRAYIDSLTVDSLESGQGWVSHIFINISTRIHYPRKLDQYLNIILSNKKFRMTYEKKYWPILKSLEYGLFELSVHKIVTIPR